jgi:hypothetical protein
MKQFLLPLMILGLASSLQAQPTHPFELDPGLYGSTANFVYGLYVEPGPAGPNQTWDFSDMTTLSSADVTFLHPDDTPFSSAYPEANLAILADGNNSDQYVFSKIEADGVYTLGQEVLNDFSVSQIYTDSRRDIASPLNYQQTYSDSAYADVTLTFEGLMATIASNFVAEVDGYGTLITPQGTFENVLRIHGVETIETALDMGLGEPIISESILDSYAWFIDGYPLPIFITSTETTNGQTDSGTARYVANISTPTLARNYNTLGGISLYPVPAVDFVTLDLGDNKLTQGQIRLFDVKGTLIQSHALNSGAQQMLIDVSALPPGFYSVQIYANEGIATNRFVK